MRHVVFQALQKLDSETLLYCFIFHFFVDIDECMTESANNCDEDAVCLNSLGSFVCTCGDGFFGNGVECDGKEV